MMLFTPAGAVINALDAVITPARPCDSCAGAIGGQCIVRAVNQPRQTEIIADGVWINQIEVADAGTVLPQHSHVHPHVTSVTKGSVRLECSGEDPVVYSAPAQVIIPALVKHLFITLTDDVILLCIHRIDRTGIVEISEEHQIVD